MNRSDRNVDHIDRLELAGDTDCQTFMGELSISGKRPAIFHRERRSAIGS